MTDSRILLEKTRQLAERWAGDRAARQRRTGLEQADFDALAEAGYLLVGVPVERGGLWETVPRSARMICEALRTLAHGDSSVALVSAMHPAVLSYWLTTPTVDGDDASWQQQRREIFDGVAQGTWWGTITSEPGSGGDVLRTRTVAEPGEAAHEYFLTGQKHFGSGSGQLDVMVTTAVAAGESEPDWFFAKTRGVPWDGSAGVRLLGAWDGHGMIATQSHSMEFEEFPATRIAWPGNLPTIALRSGPFIGCLFTSVIVGIVEVAIETARARLTRGERGAFEQVEWAHAEKEAWLITQAYEGMLRALQEQDDPRRDVLQGKTAIAELSESVLLRLCRTIGGGTFARHSPFGFWFEDVRALGFLRPPWALAYDTLIAGLPREEA